eukprot:scaffold374926_cov43-Attheya_sp.AAC.1
MALNQHVHRSTETTVRTENTVRVDVDSDDNEDQDRGNILYENVQESTKEEILEQMRKPAIVGNMEAKRSLVLDVVTNNARIIAKLET